MAKTDRVILVTNDQSYGQIADPNKLENMITHAFDKIDENDTEFINHKKEVAPTSADTVRDKHVSNNDLKVLQDQITTNLTDLTEHKKQVDPTSSDTTRNKHVSNNDLKTLQDQITTNDTASNNRDNTHKGATVLDHPDQSVTTEKLKDLAVTSGKIAVGAIGRNQLDPTLFEQTANASKFQEIDAQLAENVTDLKQREVNVRQPPYNAKADGIADDTSIIQSAIESLGASGGTVFLPDGIYKTTTTIIIPKYVKVRGSSSRGTIIHYYGTGTAVNLKYNNPNIGLETIQIERKNANKVGTVGVLLESSLFCTLKDVRALDFETGYKVDGKDLWCASNIFYNLFALRCTNGIHITANTGKQSNHNIFFGGYIVGELPQVVGSKGVIIERGDSNRFYGTAVEDYDIGYHFIAVDAGGNSAISPRVERCNINYLLDPNTINTNLIDPFGVGGIDNRSQSNLILTRIPSFRGDNVTWGNGIYIKWRDSGGVIKDVLGVDSNNDVIYKTPSFSSTKSHSFEVADTANVHRKELTVKTEEVSIRRYIKHGTINTLPTSDSTQRRREIFIEGGTGVADKLCVCVKKADDSYGWFDKISGTFV